MNAKSVIASERARLVERALIFLMPFAFTSMLAVAGWLLNAYVLGPQAEDRRALIELQATVLKQSVAIQDHEARMVFGKTAREAFQTDTVKQLEKIDSKIDTMTDRMGDVAVTLGALRATLNERLPSRNQQTGLNEVRPCNTASYVTPCQ